MNNEEKILQVVFEEPNRDFHIRLLARLTKLHPNTVMTVTDALAKEGLIIKQKDKGTKFIFIRANTENRLYKIKKQYYNIIKLYASGLINFLNDTYAYPTIILFGSYAKAENDKKSDIDLFIITETKKHIELSSFEKALGAEIQIFLHTKEEFKKLKKTNPELINNVINGYKLEGYVEAL